MFQPGAGGILQRGRQKPITQTCPVNRRRADSPVPCWPGRAGLPVCLINSGTEEEKPAWSCLKVIKFLCRLSAPISTALR